MKEEDNAEEDLPNSKVEPEENKFPFTICWTPYSGLSQFIPIAGHASVGDADGQTHDFNDINNKGKGTISVGQVSYGKPYKYHQLGVTTLKMNPAEWNKAIADTSKQFEGKPYSILSNNSYHYVAAVLNNMNYAGHRNHSVLTVIFMLIF